MSRTFADKLARLMLETTKGETVESGLPAETFGEVVETVASMLGKFIALQCGGHQESMSSILDSATQHMHETAADTKRAGQFLADPKNWFIAGADGVRTPAAEQKIVYTDRHWYNQEIARAGMRLLMERPRKKINGVEMLSAEYDPEMIGMVATSLSEQLGKLVALICQQHPGAIDEILEMATHNAFEVAAKFKSRIVKIDEGDVRKL